MAALASRPATSGGRRPPRTPPRRYVVANGYGADPAAGTDRVLLEHDPFAVLEGAAIAAFAIGATEAIIAVRAEATETIRRLESAIGAAEEAGFLGFDVLGSGHDIDLSVRPVQGAYMLGEETVLLKALEGKRGQPEQRPPYPADRGLYGMPTVVNNVQTLASVPWILRNGPEAFAAIGARTPGTILVQVRTPAADGHRGGAARDAVARDRRPRRQAPRRPHGQGGPRRRPVRRPAAAGPPGHAVRLRVPAREPAPTSARARSSSPTTGPASWTSPAC